MNPDEYETHARSNESLRDAMDGVLEENRNAQSQETCNKCEDCKNCPCNTKTKGNS